MTSKNLFSNIFGIKAKQNSYLFVLTFLAFLFTTSMPVALGMLNIDSSRELDRIIRAYENMYDACLVGNVFHGLIVVSFSVFTAMMLYRYLHSKTEVDFYHSLPIRREKLFVGNYIIGIVYFVTCYLFHMFLSLVMFALAGRWDVVDMHEVTGQLLSTILAFIAIYSVTVFASTICGNLYVTAMVALGLMLVIPAYILCFVGLGEQFLDYFVADTAHLEEIMSMTSPLINYFSNSWFVGITASSNWGYALVIVASVLGGVYAYKKRPSEQATNAMVFGKVRFVIKSLGTVLAFFLGGFLFSAILNQTENMITFVLGGIFVAFLAHAIFEVLFESDIRAALKNMHHFVGYVVVGTVITLVFVLDLTGYSKALPDREDIVAVAYENTVLEAAENIDLMYHHLDNIVNGDFNQNLEYSYYLGETMLTLENGNDFQRRYGSDGRLTFDQMFALETSKEFITQSFKYDLDLETAFVEQSERYDDGAYKIETVMNESIYMNASQARDLYRLILSDAELLTPEYLSENLPVMFLKGEFYEEGARYNPYYNIPIFAIQTKALEHAVETFDISLTRTEVPEVIRLTLPNKLADEKGEVVNVSASETVNTAPTVEVREYAVDMEKYGYEDGLYVTDALGIELALSHMTATEDGGRYVGTGGNYSMEDKNVVAVYDMTYSEYSGSYFIGYIQLDDYLEMEEELGVVEVTQESLNK